MGEDGLSLLLTSRLYPTNIQSAFKHALKIDLEAKKTDIESYFREVMEINPDAKSLFEEELGIKLCNSCFKISRCPLPLFIPLFS